MKFFKKKKIRSIDPDEVFLDAYNSAGFNTQQFEGRMERPISKISIGGVGLVFVVIISIFFVKLGSLQIVKGETYFQISENNTLHRSLIFSDRGVVYDRKGVELTWNENREENESFALRSYMEDPGFGVLLGYVKYPKKDSDGFYWQTEYLGVDGVEQQYNDILNGENGYKLVEKNALGERVSENVVNKPIQGENLYLTIDAGLQSAMYSGIEELSNRVGYQGGAGIVMDLATGNLLVATSYPEYDPQVFSNGTDIEIIRDLLNDPRTPFLNRAISGLYSPGSTVKPFIALGALNEGIITPTKRILSTGQIKVQSPYDPDVFSLFRDWKEGGHGNVNMVEALGDSVNTYFYSIGGGYKNQEGLGITKIEKYIRMFGIGSNTNSGIWGEINGVVPNPEWKAEVFDGDIWRLGDTYNTSIGQYGFQVTPIQMANSVAQLITNGDSPNPTLLQRINPKSNKTSDFVPFDQKDIDVVKDGMRQVVTSGTGGLLNVSSVNIAAKTGTAQTGFNNEFVNSWSVGFYPYEDPKYVFVVLMEKGPRENDLSASFAMRQFLDWTAIFSPEYLK